MIEGHLRELGMNPENYHIKAMLSITEIRNGIIRGKFAEIKNNGDLVKENYELLSKQFGMCPETIKEIVGGRR